MLFLERAHIARDKLFGLRLALIQTGSSFFLGKAFLLAYFSKTSHWASPSSLFPTRCL